MICQEIINAVFKPNSFSYLELGLGTGIPFNSVHTDKKISVDINGHADFNEGTDKFFEDYKGEKFDVIFVDANHEFSAVLRDFNNSINLLNERGIIFLHDLYPPDEDHCQPHKCGDGYKILNKFREMELVYDTLKEDFGLTAVVGCSSSRREFESLTDIKDISYKDFIKNKFNFSDKLEIIEYLIMYRLLT